MTDAHEAVPTAALRSTLAYLERETARRAKGGSPGMIRVRDDELGALVALLRREVGSIAGEAAPLAPDGMVPEAGVR